MSQQAPEKKYKIRGSENRRFWTGKTRTEQAIIGLSFPYITAVFFDREGSYLRYVERELPVGIRQNQRWRSTITDDVR